MKNHLQELEEVWLGAWQRELGPDATLTAEEQTKLHALRALEYRNSEMLSQICELTKEFCDHPDCTSVDAVKLMKSKLLELEAYKLRNEVWSLYLDIIRYEHPAPN